MVAAVEFKELGLGFPFFGWERGRVNSGSYECWEFSVFWNMSRFFLNRFRILVWI